MHLCVFEDALAQHLLPLAHTRAVYDLRIGVMTLLQSIRRWFGNPGTLLHARRSVAAVAAQENELLVNRIPEGIDVLFVNGRWVVDEGEVLERVRRAVDAREPRVFTTGDEVLAAWIPGADERYVSSDFISPATFEGIPTEDVGYVATIQRLWDFQNHLRDALERDFTLLTGNRYIYERPDVKISQGAILAAGERIYMGKGTVIRPGAILNAEHGPIYIGEEAEIMEGAVIKGPAYVGSRSQIKTGADIECSSIGFWSKVGGQVEETIVHSLSNKAHAGYLGNAYIGRWCNLGADTNNSNLKNDYGVVKMYDSEDRDFCLSNRQFLGLVMGDHTKSGINTMFNTGTVIGVCCNVYGAGFMARCIPSFSWGGPEEFTEYRLEKALAVAEIVMGRRGRTLTDAERENLAHVYQATREDVVRK